MSEIPGRTKQIANIKNVLLFVSQYDEGQSMVVSRMIKENVVIGKKMSEIDVDAIIRDGKLPDYIHNIPQVLIEYDGNDDMPHDSYFGVEDIKKWLDEKCVKKQSGYNGVSAGADIKGNDWTGGANINKDNAMNFITDQRSVTGTDRSDVDARMQEMEKERSLLNEGMDQRRVNI